MSLEKTLADRFTLTREIGRGSYSSVFLAQDQKTHKSVAVKVLSCDSHLSKETSVLLKLQQVQGVPKLFASGRAGKDHFIAMEKMHCDLYSLVKKHQRLSVPAVLWVAAEMLKVLERVHESGYLHLDIKPDNIAIKQNSERWECYLLDFGLAEKYMIAGTHYNYSEFSRKRGNPAFASSGMLAGTRPSRRDDLECLLYTIVYLANGRLHWAIPKKHFSTEKITYIRERTSPACLCAGLPAEFLEIFTHIKSLRFAEKPDYCSYQRLIARAARSLQVDLEDFREWDGLVCKKAELSQRDSGLATAKEIEDHEQPHQIRTIGNKSKTFTSRRPTRWQKICTQSNLPSLDSKSTIPSAFRGRRARNNEPTVKLSVAASKRLRSHLAQRRKSSAC